MKTITVTRAAITIYHKALNALGKDDPQKAVSGPCDCDCWSHDDPVFRDAHVNCECSTAPGNRVSEGV